MAVLFSSELNVTEEQLKAMKGGTMSLKSHLMAGFVRCVLFVLRWLLYFLQ